MSTCSLFVVINEKVTELYKTSERARTHAQTLSLSVYVCVCMRACVWVWWGGGGGHSSLCYHLTFPANCQKMMNIVWYHFHEARSTPESYWWEQINPASAGDWTWITVFVTTLQYSPIEDYKCLMM